LFFAGCDVGAISAKVVILEEDTLLVQETMAYKMLPREAAIEVMEKALANAGLSLEQLDGCVACGFGRKVVPYANGDVPEIMSLSKGVRWAHSGVKTVIDAGGQKIRAFNIGENGKVSDSATNEKCASGTGRFIEVMARALDLSLDSASALASEATDPVSITSQCGVFAERAYGLPNWGSILRRWVRWVRHWWRGKGAMERPLGWGEGYAITQSSTASTVQDSRNVGCGSGGLPLFFGLHCMAAPHFKQATIRAWEM